MRPLRKGYKRLLHIRIGKPLVNVSNHNNNTSILLKNLLKNIDINVDSCELIS